MLIKPLRPFSVLVICPNHFGLGQTIGSLVQNNVQNSLHLLTQAVVADSQSIGLGKFLDQNETFSAVILDSFATPGSDHLPRETVGLLQKLEARKYPMAQLVGISSLAGLRAEFVKKGCVTVCDKDPNEIANAIVDIFAKICAAMS